MSLVVPQTRVAGMAERPAPPVSVRRPREQTHPIVIASPHSGRNYPDDFVAKSRLDPLALRRSEDSFVDELFGQAPDFGLPLIAAEFPRAYCDVNREPYELDPQMFEDRLPAFVNTRSVRVACGLGTIARIVSDGAEIYRSRLPFAEAERRLEECYRPYHALLRGLMEETLGRFGTALLIDCHSMPSIGGPMEQDAGLGRADIVLGDRYGTSADPRLVDLFEREFKTLGYSVVRNLPYAGGNTTQIYGRPARGLHTIQIEINRALYMEERRIEKSADFPRIMRDLTLFMERVAARIEPRHFGSRLP